MSATLQQSLLPRELPQIEQVTVAVRYRASAAHAQVGGDWYDVVATPGGGATLVVGDVQGHSLAAAAVMGQLRTALHAYLSEGHHPDVALARANLLMSQLDPSVLATCAIFALDPRTGSARIVRAGHPLPVLRRGDGSVCEVDVGGGVPLGVMDQAAWPVTTVTLEAGDRLLLYTDGLVERRNADLDEGVAGCCRRWRTGPQGAPPRRAATTFSPCCRPTSATTSPCWSATTPARSRAGLPRPSRCPRTSARSGTRGLS